MAVTNHPAFPQPDSKFIPVWRYLDFAKFVSLLQKRALFFSRANRLGDPFEGSVTKFNKQMRDYAINFANSDPKIRQAYPALQHMTEPAQIQKYFDAHSERIQRNTEQCMVSCWHMNIHESAAMWKLYSKSDESICIKTTYFKLSTQLPEWVLIGRVRYADYTAAYIPEFDTFTPLMHKRRSFEHESEVRALVSELLHMGSPEEMISDAHEIRSRMTEFGIDVPIIPEKLIDAVYINPTAPQWFTEVVRAACKALAPELGVKQSSLTDAPIF